MDATVNTFPPQQLSSSQKTTAWRKQVLDWADSKTFFNYSPVRKSVIHKKINYDLLNGKLHMKDLALILNPEKIQAGFIPDRIQHYPIINSKLNVLLGEEAKRPFDYRAIVTNPTAISSIEENKKEALMQDIQQWLSTQYPDEQTALAELQKLGDYYTYNWKDIRELRANYLLNHYVKELNIPLIFNLGFQDAKIVAEEIYQCDIVSGEPTLRRLNPLKVRIFQSGYSNKIEDADMVIIEDYWSPGRIYDTYYDKLTSADIKYLLNIPNHIGQSSVDAMGNVDERYGFINNYMIGDEITTQEGFFWDPMMSSEGIGNSLLPYDLAGNVRVLKVYWKSRRKIKKIKSYDPQTGEETYNFYPETYIADKAMGEEEQSFFINEAWEGTKIGSDIYIDMKPRVVQYNRLSNPSRCHFGIIGNIYNMNDNRPYSMVDMMKPYNYEYDIIHDRLNKLIAKNWGNILRLDFAKKPKGWDVEKWLYYAKTMGLAVEDSFNEGNIGAATGKLAGALNNASTGVIAASDGNQIQQYISLLTFIEDELSQSIGISRLREGQISNRETVGGVERATLLSSYITEWIFTQHDDLKRRVMECLLETAKAALKGLNKKFQYILSDGTSKIIDIDGDEFAECDYGIVVDSENGSQVLNQKIDTLAQAALQNQKLTFSTIMKLYSSCSLSEKQRMIELDELRMQETMEQQQLQQLQAQQQAALAQMQMQQEQMQQQDDINKRDNETKILVAQIQAESKSMDNKDIDENQPMSEEARTKLDEQIREFNETLKVNKDKLSFDKQKLYVDAELKNKLINKQSAVSKTNNK